MPSSLEPVPLGIALGLFIGKPVGIFGATWLAVASGLAPRPEGASWAQLLGVGMLGGIGFTMSLFIGMLAFTEPAHAAQLRLGVLVGLAAVGARRAICVLRLQRACAARIAGMILVSSVSRRDRADVLVGDAALAVDDERLGHAVDAPLDGRAAVAIDADRGEGIAVAAEEAARGRRLVLVVDAVERARRCAP